jgi:LPS-assembly protein
MSFFRVNPMVLLLSCACSTGFAAEDSALGLKPSTSAEGLKLKLQPSLIRIPPENTDEVPLFVDADSIQGHQEKEIEAEGSVRLRKRGQAVFGDWLRYDKPEDEVNARGNVRLEKDGDVLQGDRLRLYVDAERGTIEKPKYEVQVRGTRGRGEADQMQIEGQGKYRVTNGSYTSCEVGNDDWFVRADSLEIDKGRELGIARGATIEMLGRTVFYTPYLSFSLDNQRKSGFLSPTFGTSANSGAMVTVPYYWNIAPNHDATITPRVLSKRGLQVNNEFRYLDYQYAGNIRFDVLPNDRVKNGDTRYAMSLLHNQTLPYGWVGGLNIQKVSDDTFFTDLGTTIAVTSQSLLPRQGTLARGGNWWGDGTWQFSALVQRWQTLQTDPLVPVSAPYSRTPEISFSANKQNVGYTDFDLFSSFVDFRHPSLVNGKRAVAYPSVALPLQTSYAYLTPKIGVHSTYYDFDQATTTLGDQSRTLPIFSTETGVVLERPTRWFGERLTQTLEPKLYYVYIPTRNQNQLPNFDSALQDVNFATLYTENQFSGNDRINDANQLTLGVTSRFLNAENGLERLRVGLAQRYYFKGQEVTLPGVPPRGSSNSDLLAVVSGTVAPHWTVDTGWQYTTDLSQTQRFNIATRYQPEPGKVLNLSYRYTNPALVTTQPQASTLRQVDISTQWPITARWTGIARWNYSLVDGKLIEGLGGLEYNGGCWAFRVVGHRFVTATQSEVSSIFVQLELNGLSKIGSNPLELLRRSISGYYREDPHPSRPDAPFPSY